VFQKNRQIFSFFLIFFEKLTNFNNCGLCKIQKISDVREYRLLLYYVYLQSELDKNILEVDGARAPVPIAGEASEPEVEYITYPGPD